MPDFKDFIIDFMLLAFAGLAIWSLCLSRRMDKEEEPIGTLTIVTDKDGKTVDILIGTYASRMGDLMDSDTITLEVERIKRKDL